MENSFFRLENENQIHNFDNILNKISWSYTINTFPSPIQMKEYKDTAARILRQSHKVFPVFIIIFVGVRGLGSLGLTNIHYLF